MMESVFAGFYHMPESVSYIGVQQLIYPVTSDTTLTKITDEESRRLASICGRPTSRRKYPWAVSLSLHVG